MLQDMPIRQMQPKKFQFILWGMAVFLFLIGSLCLYSSFHAPDDKFEAAARLRGLSIWSYCFAAAVIAIERATKSLVKRD